MPPSRWGNRHIPPCPEYWLTWDWAGLQPQSSNLYLLCRWVYRH
jgi:hypothetical protein